MTAQNTCTHDVVPEERGPEPQWQHKQVGPQAGEQLLEAGGPCAEVSEGPGHQDAMGMEAHYVVFPGVQISGLHQLEHKEHEQTS